MENTKKDSPEVAQEDSKTKVLDLQELDEASGGLQAWSTASGGCGGVEPGEWSTASNDCR